MAPGGVFALPLVRRGFLVDALPKDFQDAVLWLPMVHGTEMVRDGYFGSKIVAHYDIMYLVTCNMVLTLFALRWNGSSAGTSSPNDRSAGYRKTTMREADPLTSSRALISASRRARRSGFRGKRSRESTLIRLIGGIDVRLQERSHGDMQISWPLAFTGAFQGALTGIDNIRFICRVYGTPIEDVLDYVEDFSQLGRFLNEPVKIYSSGMRARLAFALSLMIDFDCYPIDEVVAVGGLPLSGSVPGGTVRPTRGPSSHHRFA